MCIRDRAILRWHIQRGVIAIPKSADPARQAATLDVFWFTLTDSEMAAMGGLDYRRLDSAEAAATTAADQTPAEAPPGRSAATTSRARCRNRPSSPM